MRQDKPQPKGRVEGGEVFPPYYSKWVRPYLELTQIRSDVHSKRSQLKEAEGAPVSDPSYHDNLKKSYETIKSDRVAFLEEVLRKHQLHEHPLNFLEDLDKYRPAYQLPKLPEFSELLEAAKCLTHGTLTFAGKATVIARLKKEIAELEKRASAIIEKDDRLKFDADPFVDAWKRKQNSYSDPITPFGVALKLSKQPEKDAWKSLGIGKYINENAPNRAWDNPLA
ncbi:MAG: hypothetical protein HN416_15610 [Nitrospina sp.]|jgi:hypothetical protein|nr:hypothetical protein [Nitrospina sp.]